MCAYYNAILCIVCTMIFFSRSSKAADDRLLTNNAKSEFHTSRYVSEHQYLCLNKDNGTTNPLQFQKSSIFSNIWMRKIMRILGEKSFASLGIDLNYLLMTTTGRAHPK